MSEYGLTGLRDSSGDLKAQEHAFSWQGDTVKIKLIPPSTSELDEYENFGEDADVGDLERVIDKHLVKPEVDSDDLTAPELFAYLNGIIDYCKGDMDGLAGEAQAELEKREAAGN